MTVEQITGIDEVRQGLLVMEERYLEEVLVYLRRLSPAAVGLANEKGKMLRDLDSGKIPSTTEVWVRWRGIGQEFPAGTAEREIFILAEAINSRLATLSKPDVQPELSSPGRSSISWDGR